MTATRFVLWAMPRVACGSAGCPVEETHHHPIKVRIGTYRSCLVEVKDRRASGSDSLYAFKIGPVLFEDPFTATPYDDSVDAVWLCRWAPKGFPMERP